MAVVAPGATQQGDDNYAAWEWMWGPGSMMEAGEAAVLRFIAGLMAERTSGGGGAEGNAAADGGGGDGEI